MHSIIRGALRWVPGGGNHFAELQQVDRIVVLIRSLCRGYKKRGYYCARYTVVHAVWGQAITVVMWRRFRATVLPEDTRRCAPYA